MTGSYLLRGNRVGEVILHIDDDKLEVSLPGSINEPNVDPESLKLDVSDELARLESNLSPVPAEINFMRSVKRTLGMPVHPSESVSRTGRPPSPSGPGSPTVPASPVQEPNQTSQTNQTSPPPSDKVLPSQISSESSKA